MKQKKKQKKMGNLYSLCKIMNRLLSDYCKVKLGS